MIILCAAYALCIPHFNFSSSTLMVMGLLIGYGLSLSSFQEILSQPLPRETIGSVMAVLIGGLSIIFITKGLKHLTRNVNQITHHLIYVVSFALINLMIFIFVPRVREKMIPQTLRENKRRFH